MTIQSSDPTLGKSEWQAGFADDFDTCRPSPPPVIVDILTQVAQTSYPRLVVDLGCGTGLSTNIWADKAESVIGIDNTYEMLHTARIRAGSDKVRYVYGTATQTGLTDGCADIVTCSQSLHWMNPAEIFGEVRRILRPNGVFAAYDFDWPPTIDNWEAEMALNALMARVFVLEKERQYATGFKRWDKYEHLARMRESGYFRYTKEIVVHQVERGNAERLIGLALSHSFMAAVLRKGLNKAELGFDTFESTVRHALGPKLKTWYFSYRIRLGIV
jgi:ubiquinone/menaquinone biosynthesis C-methylase UbiE